MRHDAALVIIEQIVQGARCEWLLISIGEYIVHIVGNLLLYDQLDQKWIDISVYGHDYLAATYFAPLMDSSLQNATGLFLWHSRGIYTYIDSYIIVNHRGLLHS